MDPYTAAKEVRQIYFTEEFAFPRWTLKPEHWDNHRFADTKVFYHQDRCNVEDVVALMREREPCNIGMRRMYHQDSMKEVFGYSVGAYAYTNEGRQMPNLAVYCNATMRLGPHMANAHVLNLIGVALDHPKQPDFIYFRDRPIEDLIHAYRRMWELALAAAKRLPTITTVALYNVGGGAFAGKYGPHFATDVFEPAFAPLRPLFEEAGLRLTGYDWNRHRFTAGPIPDILETDNLAETLYINAWDPWSLIGNGNENDNSLDGAWGRISNMAVLGWLPTNPLMEFVPV
jgi:hypothetical protein